MNISKQDALEWFEFLSELPGNKKDIYNQYSDVIEAIFRQIELSVNKKHKDLQNEIPTLETLKGRTHFVGDKEKFPKGCISCLFGTGLGGIRKTHQCNLTCKFCYYHDNIDNQDKIPNNMWEIGENLYYEEDIELLLSIQQKPSGIAYVYLEPFLEIEKYYGMVKKLADAGIYQHMYTNGTLSTEENLKALADAGLNELRFNLGASNCSDKVIEAMKIAKKYFPMVGIETPMTPEFLETFLKKKDAILETGIDFINCAELHFGEDNINNYTGEKMYMSRRGYISPLWSREITLQLMKMASEERWNLVVHDCSNHTKFSRELNKNSKQGGIFGSNTYYSEFDRILYHLFLPILKDNEFKFLIEEEIEDQYNLENCREDILSMVDSDEDEEMYEEFYFDEEETEE
ncbi:radical SAM protein [Cetobacterium sp. 2A]|uniref:radical SAM protein n=1 Tax=Cetobacterium sp. 2A TaxID=2754723 RepID=UPI00163D3C6F|nr:radical SAM protein [Cetobacterium sp. 2A]MBC2856765.1 radical SAM protein [Cetobacterium sp. 2A]